MATEKDCGSASCLAKHVEGALAAQQAQGMESIKQLMQTHYTALDQRIEEVKQAAKDQGKEVFPRLNRMECDIIAIKTDIGPNGLDAKISQNADVRWARGYKGFMRAVAVVVVAFIITGGITYFFSGKVKTPETQIIKK